MRKTYPKSVKKLESVEIENRGLCKENVELKERLLDLEYRQRRNNLIFEGLNDNLDETDLDCIAKLCSALASIPGLDSTNFKIERCHRLDGKFKPTKIRRVICCFNWHYDIQCILRNRKKLPKGIFVQEDFPEEWVDRRRVLRPIFNAARRNNDLKKGTFLKKDKLVINGTTFTAGPTMNVMDANKLLNVADTCQKTDENNIVFLGVHSVFSNFHPTPICINNVDFNSAEQLIQSEKAALFGDDITQAKIMRETNPFQIKKLGSKVRNYKETVWNKNNKEIAYAAIKAKFLQNPMLGNLLCSTGDVTIAEGSLDSYWGTGIHLHDKNALDDRFWVDGKGLMGEILEKVRHELRCQNQS